MFSSGPFSYERAAPALPLNGKRVVTWALSYGSSPMGEIVLQDHATQSEVIEAFDDVRADFSARMRKEHAPDVLRLTDCNGGTLASVFVSRWPDGMTGCIPDDRYATWLLTSDKPTRGKPVTLQEFADFVGECAAPANSWIAGLLPADVLTEDAEQWRAPSAWEIRHIVGEGSFIGMSGAKAAALVGITPQNFRKYTAADSASTRQNMSFAMWHALLHKLGVKKIGGME